MRKVFAAVAVVLGAGVFPGAATAAWSAPVRVSAVGRWTGAALEDDGVLQVGWDYGGAPFFPGSETGLSLATHTGRVRETKPTALSKHLLGAVFLAGGRALTCSVNENRYATSAKVYVSVYSRAGALLRKLLVADHTQTNPYIFSSCQVAGAGNLGVVEFNQATGASVSQGAARQLYIARLLPGPSVSAPVPVLAPDADEQTVVPNLLNSQVSVSPTGWAAVAWEYFDVLHKSPSGTDDETWQWRMSWVSPSGVVGPAIALSPSRTPSAKALRRNAVSHRIRA